MLFEYSDDDGLVLQWCQGEVIEFTKELDEKHVIVKIEWNEKCLKEGDSTITKQSLLRTKWNPDKPSNGALMHCKSERGLRSKGLGINL